MSSDDRVDVPKGDDAEALGSEAESEPINEKAEKILGDILDKDFHEWYQQRQFEKNIREGNHYYNGPPQLKPPGKFRASDLLKCKRKIFYKHLIAPQEKDDPDGIFWTGTVFEEDLAEQFIQDSISEHDAYVRNGMWASFDLDTDIGKITVNGSTDPVVVTEENVPLSLSEIKTRKSIKYTSEPSRHHKAQVHAYLYGLSQRSDRDVTEALLLYADRTTFDVKTFHVPFDVDFWNEIVDWLKRSTWYRIVGKLPPAEPEADWECKYCDYRNRCGNGAEFYDNEGPAGFLPLFTGYPRSKVTEYLEAHENAKLTPSLAHRFPELAEEHGAFQWECSQCDSTFLWDEVEPIDPGENTPECPECKSNGTTGYLSGPDPDDQHLIEVVDRPHATE